MSTIKITSAGALKTLIVIHQKIDTWYAISRQKIIDSIYFENIFNAELNQNIFVGWIIRQVMDFYTDSLSENLADSISGMLKECAISLKCYGLLL